MNTFNNNTDLVASTHLGKKSAGSELYCPDLLVPVPRFENRKQYNISNDDLPFCGWDVWHAYEFSCMTEYGVPITRVLKLKYSCESEFIIESKSLKLYLNSFNMTKLGKNILECLSLCKSYIAQDLSSVLRTEVYVEFLSNNATKSEIFSDYVNVLELVDESSLQIEYYKEAPEVLTVIDIYDNAKTHCLTFDSLRSNCRVTHQPDFGDVFITYTSKKKIDVPSLVQYLVSFRSEYHFHEECCEMIYKRISDILNENDELFVCALYTRRGGIDICPARWSRNFSAQNVSDLLDLSIYARHGIKQ